MVLIIDNYDSFTYNLYQYVGEITEDVKVFRNDSLTIDDIKVLNPSHIILSPGPGKPKDAGICEEVLKKLKDFAPILGVCLGHQAIGEVFGATVDLAPELVHGKQDEVNIKTNNLLFKDLPKRIKAARYHSLIVKKDSVPQELLNLGETDKGEIMALKHRDYEIYGVQFHPESIMTLEGKKIITNFLNITGGKRK